METEQDTSLAPSTPNDRQNEGISKGSLLTSPDSLIGSTSKLISVLAHAAYSFYCHVFCMG